MVEFEDDPELAFVKMVRDGLITAQGIAFANRQILREIVGELAAGNDDPRKYISDLFERISARMDAQPLESQRKEVAGFEREMLAKFFALVERDIGGKARSR